MQKKLGRPKGSVDLQSRRRPDVEGRRRSTVEAPPPTREERAEATLNRAKSLLNAACDVWALKNGLDKNGY